MFLRPDKKKLSLGAKGTDANTSPRFRCNTVWLPLINKCETAGELSTNSVHDSAHLIYYTIAGITKN